MLRRLTLAVSEKQVRQKMIVEDEIVFELEERDRREQRLAERVEEERRQKEMERLLKEEACRREQEERLKKEKALAELAEMKTQTGVNG